MSLMIASTKKAETTPSGPGHRQNSGVNAPEESPLERSRRAAVERKNSNTFTATGGGATAAPMERRESFCSDGNQ